MNMISRLSRAAPAKSVVVLYSITLCVTFGLDHVNELADMLLPVETAAIVRSATGWYNSVLARGPRHVNSRFVTLIAISPEVFPKETGSACLLRGLTAKLIAAATQEGANVVGVDIAFAKDSCQETDEGHKELEAALRAAAARQTPIILLKYTHDAGFIRERYPELAQNSKLRATELVPAPLADSLYSLPEVRSGVRHLNDDIKRIPLSWAVRKPLPSDISSLEGAKSLAPATGELGFAVEIASAYLRLFPTHRFEVEKLLTSGAHPITRLLPDDDWLTVDASKLLEGSDSEKRLLRGRVVMIGALDHRDLVDGHFGLKLQANYVEALLDGRFLRPVSRWILVLVSLFWFLVIELIYMDKGSPLPRIAMNAIGASLFMTLLLYYVAAVNLGWYLALWPPGVAATMFRLWQKYVERKVGGYERASGKTSEIVSPNSDAVTNVVGDGLER